MGGIFARKVWLVRAKPGDGAALSIDAIAREFGRHHGDVKIDPAHPTLAIVDLGVTRETGDAAWPRDDRREK